MIIGAAAIAGAVVLVLLLTGKLKTGGVFSGQPALLTAASTAASADSASGAAGTGAEADSGGETAAGGAGVNAIDLEAASGTGNTPTPVSAHESAAEHPWHTPLERYFMDKNFWRGCPERNVQLLTPNEYSRPEIGIDAVNDIVVHYVDEA